MLEKLSVKCDFSVAIVTFTIKPLWARYVWRFFSVFHIGKPVAFFSKLLKLKYVIGYTRKGCQKGLKRRVLPQGIFGAFRFFPTQTFFILQKQVYLVLLFSFKWRFKSLWNIIWFDLPFCLSPIDFESTDLIRGSGGDLIIQGRKTRRNSILENVPKS